MELAALTPEVTQQVLHRQSDSPTRPARHGAGLASGVSIGVMLCHHYARGFFPGLPSLADSPSVPENIQMTSPQVRFSSSFITDLDTLSPTTSRH